MTAETKREYLFRSKFENHNKAAYVFIYQMTYVYETTTLFCSNVWTKKMTVSRYDSYCATEILTKNKAYRTVLVFIRCEQWVSPTSYDGKGGIDYKEQSTWICILAWCLTFFLEPTFDIIHVHYRIYLLIFLRFSLTIYYCNIHVSILKIIFILYRSSKFVD